MKMFRFLIVAVATALLCTARAAEPVSGDLVVSITSVSSLTNQALQVVDLLGIGGSKTRGDAISVELEVLTGATAPGASRNITVYFGFSNLSTYSATEMATSVENLEIDLVNSASTKQVFSLPVVFVGGRYLYVWFDHSARDAGSTLTLTSRIAGLSR